MFPVPPAGPWWPAPSAPLWWGCSRSLATEGWGAGTSGRSSGSPGSWFSGNEPPWCGGRTVCSPGRGPPSLCLRDEDTEDQQRLCGEHHGKRLGILWNKHKVPAQDTVRNMQNLQLWPEGRFVCRRWCRINLHNLDSTQICCLLNSLNPRKLKNRLWHRLDLSFLTQKDSIRSSNRTWNHKIAI